MLKHKEQIEGLTAAQKIALLVDGSGKAEGELSATGILPLAVAELWSGNTARAGSSIYPSAASLANSWNPALFADVAKRLAHRGAKQGTNLFLLPDSKAPCSIYGKGLSEDPRLNAALLNAAAKGLEKQGSALCMQAPVPTDEDVDCLHGEVDARMLHDRMVRPFSGALNGTRCHAVLLPKEGVAEGYTAVGEKMMREAMPARAEVLCPEPLHDHTVNELMEHRIILGGSASALEAALRIINASATL